MQLRDAKHLANQVITRTEDVPSYALLLGSGASASSGVKTAEQLVIEWRTNLYQRAETVQPFPEWIANQSWYGTMDEYGQLFEIMYDLPNPRRIVVEDLLRDTEPSWGYAYLANLLDHHYFNVVLTTNFDDLLTEACYRYTNSVRPLVAAHDSTIRNLRVTSARPKIIKLHGDFLYDNIRNTPSETASLEENIEEKMRQFAREYGLIVIGYSGRDASVMKSLESLLTDSASFPNGIYWCTKDLSVEMSLALQRIADDNRVHFVEIEGFDEVLAEIHRATRLSLPTGLSEPFRFTRDRAASLVYSNSHTIAHPIITKDIDLVMDGLTRIPETVAEVLPVELLATIAEHQGNQDIALGWWQQAYDADKTDEWAASHVMGLLADLGQLDKLQQLVESAPLGDDPTYWNLLAGRNHDVIRLAEDILAENPFLEFTRINKAIALKRLGRHEEKETEVLFLEGQLRDGLLQYNTNPISLLAGVEALRDNRERLLDRLGEAIKRKELSPRDARRFPVFEDFRNDKAFKSLVDSYDLPRAFQLTMEPISRPLPEDATG